MPVCPKCRSGRVQAVATKRPEVRWFECGSCRHFWNHDPLPMDMRCSKCESPTVVLNRSVDLSLLVVQCEACGYASVVAGAQGPVPGLTRAAERRGRRA